MGAQATVKYHYFYRFFTYSVKRERAFTGLVSGVKRLVLAAGRDPL